MPSHDAGPPEEEVPAQDPIEEIAHTATEEVAEGELLDETDHVLGAVARPTMQQEGRPSPR